MLIAVPRQYPKLFGKHRRRTPSLQGQCPNSGDTADGRVERKAEQAIEGLFDLPRVLAAGAQDRLNEGRVLTHCLLMDGVDFGGKLAMPDYRINWHGNSP
jgi:hypothetical protein